MKPDHQEIGSNLFKETNVFEASKAGPKYLDLLLKALQAIPPTSVETERAFSSLRLLTTKIRNSLNILH